MDFSFGFITSGHNEGFLNTAFDQIRNMKIPNYQIVLVGNSALRGNDITYIPFDDNQKPNWITRKKNIITIVSKYENVVYSHDYVGFSENWYEGFKQFGNNWNVCMTPMNDKDGTRFRDWVLWIDDAKRLGIFDRQCILPYNLTGLSKFQYISGTYWVAKRRVMMEFPLNESLCWGQGEDCEWSFRVRQKYNFSINTNSPIHFLKQKGGRAFDELVDENIINRLKSFNI